MDSSFERITKMKLRRYCVTVVDYDTPRREFWFLKNAKKYHQEHQANAYLFKWEQGNWKIILRPSVAV